MRLRRRRRRHLQEGQRRGPDPGCCQDQRRCDRHREVRGSDQSGAHLRGAQETGLVDHRRRHGRPGLPQPEV